MNEDIRAEKLTGEEGVALERKLSEVDINLLVALDGLLSYRNVTYAARRVGLSQPAMSRVLAKLRDFLGDDLLVRASTGMRLTMRAEYLAQLVPLAMSQARGIIGTEGAPDGRITISANLMPVLLPHLARSSNLAGQRLRISTHRLPADAVAQLRSRIVDVILGSVMQSAEDIDYETVCDEDFVTLTASEEHWLADIGPDAFLSMSHINLIDAGGEMFPQIAAMFAAQGLNRTDLLELPDIASAASMAAQGQLALTVPRSMAGWLTRTHRLFAFPPPFSFPNHEIHIAWRADDHDRERPPLVKAITTATRRAIAQDQAAVRW
ncbi:putative HTH-type transcriptional regulator SyrM [Agrobacterium tumefaciens str. Kerr 14]|uniref:Putative HTH-type transcriptional regulator SyrM n=1 Tax=Agrobacterium tumefaciens str. Kerr 14 TaxID=1183424 RepID=A0A1S7SB50_AGRTU|nr:LysR family transcriptional regulator [Agrobacterium tumefaciens]CUX65810.1 putative HTH-type transcriptional regulator SyrM [Agrobacterium tumefaciens str. Kerr 14]